MLATTMPECFSREAAVVTRFANGLGHAFASRRGQEPLCNPRLLQARPIPSATVTNPGEKLGDRVLTLVDEAQSELHDPAIALSGVVSKAIRVARLRDDLENLYWLDLEMRSLGGDSNLEPREVQAELETRYGQDEADAIRSRAVLVYTNGRRIEEDAEGNPLNQVTGASIGEIERQIDSMRSVAETLQPSEGLHPVDLYFREQDFAKARLAASTNIRSLELVLERVRSRVASYLSKTERELLVGQAVSDLFEKNRAYVDSRLGEISEVALEQLASAYRRQAEGDSEALSQALTSCRRVLKSLADALYPAGEPAIGVDGVEREMTEDRYLARLLQFAGERMGSRSSRRLLASRIGDLATRLESLNDLASKGVHAETNEFDVNQCVIETYLLVGDFLRLDDRTAAAAQS